MTGAELGSQPAYPVADYKPDWSGMIKREAFAMAAMQGLLASQDIDARVSVQAVKFADALLEELAKEA